MILPGISGAFILVLLGKYHYILQAVNNHDFLILFIVAAGAGVGLLSFVRLLHWFFNKYHDYTIAILTGLMLGSLRKVWPWKKTIHILTDTHQGIDSVFHANVMPSCWSLEVTTALCASIIGFLAVLSLNFFADRK